MSTLLQHLNDESALLMYLAGELPAGDRALVEQRLAGDERLRDELERLRAAYEGVGAALADADAVERLALTPPAAARRVGQAVRAWHARRLAAPKAGDARRRLRIPTWAYATAAAALLAIGYTAWWGLQPDEPMVKKQGPGPESQPSEYASATDAMAGLTPEGRRMLIGPWEESAWVDAEADAVLDDAEADLYALLESSEAALTEDGSLHLLMDETDER